MNTYHVQYSNQGKWIPFQLQAQNIYDALEWTHENIQRTGVCVQHTETLPQYSNLDWALLGQS